MPSIENITGAIAAAGLRHIVVEAGRCTEVRHRMARCHACVDTCPEGAIDVRENRIIIQPELCVGCGSCANECPTQALRTAGPSREELVALVEQAAEMAFADGTPEDGASLEFACEHATPGNASARIVVPALPYVDESVVLRAAALGFDAVALTSCNDGGCIKPALAAIPDMLATARALLAAAECPCKVTLRREKPRPEPEDGKGAKRGFGRTQRISTRTTTTLDTTQAGHDSSRRGALAELAMQTRTIVAETAAAELRDRMGTPEAAPNLRQTLTDGQGNFLKFDMPRARDILDDLYVMNPEPKGTINARGFALVKVNADACTRCAMCAKFCTTGALQGESAPIGALFTGGWHTQDPRASEGNPGSLTYRPSDCVGCHLCEFTCPVHCLHVEDEIPAESIFELEPIDLLS